MSDYIPQDVLIDILTRLPTETLVRLTSVCKSWQSLITSPNFISLHLNRNANNNDTLLVHYCTKQPNQELYSLVLDDGNDSFHRLKTFDFPLSPRDYFSIVGCCNGLICLSDDDDQSGYMDDLYLWNPSIRKSVALPAYNVTHELHGPFMHCLGFGFDSVTNDFKVVRVVHKYPDAMFGYHAGSATSFPVGAQIISPGVGWYRVPPEVEIYTLKTGKWRYISDRALPLMIGKRYRQAYVNGAAHWMAYSQATQTAGLRQTILSFNMSDEVFNEILVPDSMTHREIDLEWTILVVFKESLTLIQHCEWDSVPHCSMWIMKEYGVATSWAKLFRIDMDPREGLRNPLGLRKNSEVIFHTCDGNMVSCDHQSQRFTFLGIHDTLGKVYSLCHTFCIDTYTESMVLLNYLENP